MEQFVTSCLKRFYLTAIAPFITNQDYEGDAKKGGDRVNILTFLGDVTWTNYSIGSDMNVQHLTDTEDQLLLNQKKYYNFDLDRVDKHYTYVEDADSTLIKNSAAGLKTLVDTLVLGKHTEVKAGHRIGTDYTTGTVAVNSGTGVVTGTGTTFTSAMVGKGFNVTDDSSVNAWYRISAFTSTTSITLTDWDDTAYSGDTVTAGATYIIEANAVLAVTKSTIYDKAVELGEKLDVDEIPQEDRWLAVPPKLKSLILSCDELTLAVPAAYEDVIKNGRLGMFAGFMVYISNQVAGDNTAGYYVLAGHKGFITFAMAFEESRVIDSEKQFAKLYQGLAVYGAKVATERRKCGAYGFWKV